MSLIKSFLILVGIGLFSIMLFAVGVFFWRGIGLNSPPPPAKFPFAHGEKWVWARGNSDLGPAFSRAGYAAAKELGHTILVADVRATKDRTWVVFGRGPLEKFSDGKGPVESHSLVELREFHLGGGHESIMTLPEFLERFNSPRLAVFIHSREADGVPSLIEALTTHRTPESETFIMAESQAVLREMRKRRPLWFYGSDVAELARLRLYTAVFLEPAASFSSDFINARTYEENFLALPARLIKEIARRKTPLIVESSQINDIPPEWIEHLRGILTDRPTWALKLLSL